MPKDLAALLVEDGAVPADVVERAIARQREAGGALDTALLELGAIAEDRLAAYLAHASELPPAPATAWTAADARARRVFPSRVAERHGLAPFALEGRELSLVAAYPVDLGLLDEISFMLSLHLTAHVGPEWRVRELIHRIYGTALPPRLAAIGAATGVPPGPPPAPEPEPVEERAPEARPRPPTTAATLGGFARDDEEPLEPLAAALALALESVDIAVDGEEPAPPGVAPGEAQREAEPVPEEPPPVLDRTAPPRWKLADARAAVAAARHRDEVVLAALRYARDFFEFAAMFAVTRDAVAGHDALGVEEARDRARTVAIWASDPGIFKTVIETQSPYLGPVAPGAVGTDAVLQGLSRHPRTVLVYPVMLRDRPVCILYADNGEAPVSARRLGDLLLFLSTVGGAFERIIRDRKVRPPRAAARPPEPGPAVEPAPAPAPAPVEPRVAAPPPEASAPAPAPVEPKVAAPPPEASAPAPAPVEPRVAAPPPETPAPPAHEPAPSFADLDDDVPVASPKLVAPRAPEPAAPRDGAPPRGGTALEWAAAPAPGAPVPPQSPSPASADGRTASADSLAALDDQLVARGDAPEPAAPARAPEQPVPSPPPAPAVRPRTPSPARPAQKRPSPERSQPQRTPPPVAAPPDQATLAALADRALDADPIAAEAACSALANRRRDPAVRQASEKLRRALLSGLSARATRAARALGALRDADTIPLLIQALETADPETAQAAAAALAAITLQRIGPDARRWLAWWKDNRGRGRAEWLFSGLTSPDRETRVAASLELSHAAPPPVAYAADMPAPDREKAAHAWAAWWARSGHVL